MRKRILPALLAAVCGLALFAGCGSAKSGPEAFISMCSSSDNTVVIKLGMSNDEFNVIFGAGKGGNVWLDNGLRGKWQDNTTLDKCVALINLGLKYQTMAGLSLNNKIGDVLPMYQTDPDVKVLSNDTAKIVLQKQINGVNYNMAVRAYDDGTIKYITLYNADLYTDNDADYQ